MPGFSPHHLDLGACRAQVGELRVLLQSAAEIDEGTFNQFFRARTHLSALIGLYNPAIARFDLLAWEYRLFGDFQCDIVVGDSITKAFTFIEYEDAQSNSLFVKHGAKATREWSPRFDHGYSQLVDWFYIIRVMTDTPDMEAQFGKRSIDYTGVLVVGRDQYMDAGERLRLDWRREYMVVNSKKIICVTYDQLLDDLTFRLDSYALASKAGG
jgi:hypothetical protein